MAYAEQSPRMGGPINEHASALAHEWRRLTRVATGVALLTAPAFFLLLYQSDHLSVVASLLITVLAVIAFRGVVEVIMRKLIPWPSLYGAEEGLKHDDLVSRATPFARNRPGVHVRTGPAEQVTVPEQDAHRAP